MDRRIPVAVLGATGMVGQHLLRLLEKHPEFRVGAVCASDRSVGKRYADAASWRLDGEAPPFGDLVVQPCDPGALAGLTVAISALPSDSARVAESAFRAAGYAVCTNASPFRTDPAVPLVIPEVNPDHLELVRQQPGPGFIVANPNCCAVPVALALAPLHARWGVEAACLSTWQAVSGAGYPGESAWDMVGNVHPHAGDEEDKLEVEPQKILGVPGRPAGFATSARCVRVPTADGHLVSIQVRLGGSPTPEQALEAIAGWSPAARVHSTPSPLFHLMGGRDRPMPRLDAMRGGGMAVSIGRVERCSVMGLKLYALAHNAVRGAAGAALGNLELLSQRGMLP